MSTLSTINVKHPTSASNNITLDNSGNATIANNATVTGNATVSGNITVTGTGSVGGNLSFNSGYGSAAVAYGCRAWVNFNGTGTVAIRADGGVSSITDNGTGDYTVNFDAAMPDTNFSPTVSIALSASSLNANPGVSGWEAINPSTSTCRIGIGFGGSGRNDVEVVNVHIMR